jgi:iron complex outermembrane recepter protein
MVRWAVVTVCGVLGLMWGLGLQAQDVQKLLQDYGTIITVYGDLTPGSERQILDTGAPISVITREELEASGVKTLQEALVELPGVTLHNQTGNPVESTVDLRGFPQGTSTAVFLDGVRLNDPQDNSVRWDVIPIEDVERIEVYRGATGPLYGGGALAGVVNIVTRRNPGIPRVDVKADGGSFSTFAGRLHASGSYKKFEFYATAQTSTSAGWRDNDGFRLDDGILRINYSPTSKQSLALLLQYNGGSEQAPGALTSSEMDQNPRQTPYNQADNTRGRQRLASLAYTASPAEGWSLSAQAYGRWADRDTLTTGRYGSGFLGSSSLGVGGLQAQARNVGASNGWTWDWSVGVEAGTSGMDAQGYFTDMEGGHKTPASDTSTHQHTAGAFFQGDLGRGDFHVFAGLRADRASYDYSDLMIPANGTDRTFRESTWRAGMLYHTGDWSSLFLTYSQGYRIPSIVDLFAYPGFYSNPNLVPTRAGDWEVGWRYLNDGWRFKVTAFDMSLTDEVVFVLTDPAHFIGQNQNVGSSYRRGVEAEVHIPLPKGFSCFATGSYQRSVITGGPYAGKDVPMVPDYLGTVGAQWNDADWTVRLAFSTVGPQRLDSDLSNVRPILPGYTTADLSVRYLWRGLTLQATVRNLLDKSYAGRGITNGYQDFYTPAYPCTALFSVMWSF